MSEPKVAAATEEQLPAILDILNHYIETSPINFHLEPLTLAEEREAFLDAQGKFPWLVAVVDETVVGFAYASSFRAKAAYDSSVETTIYVAPDAPRQGVGTQLYAELLPLLVDAGFHLAIAGITMPNPASTALHAKFGFQPVGTFTEVGRKYDAFHSVQFWQKLL
jgi:phosphinothricin acetyltransferase